MHANETYHPADENELAALIIQAGEQNFPLEICGNRTKKSIGRPMQTAARLSTRGMSGITLYEPTELVLSARTGTPLDEIEAKLEENGQQLAFEPNRWERIIPPSPGISVHDEPQATIGGVFATNSSGPRRILRGSARDHLIGIRAVNGLGEVIKSGGRVMKNVTGYDLSRGLVGTWGTLAALTEVTMKVMPKAVESSSLVIINLPDEAAVNAMCEAMKLPYEVSGTVHLPAEFVTRLTNPDIAQLGAPITVLRIENFSEAVSRRIAELRERLKPCGEIYQLDAVADVEGGAGVVLDQIGGGGNPKQNKTEPVKGGLAGAAVVGSPDGGKEVVRKGQPQGGINFIYKNNDLIADLC